MKYTSLYHHISRLVTGLLLHVSPSLLLFPPILPFPLRQVGKQELATPSHVVERYIELLCRYQPQDVYGFLQINDNYRVEEALDVRHELTKIAVVLKFQANISSF